MAKFICLRYDQGWVSVETCEVEDEDEAWEVLEDYHSNIMVFTVEGARAVRDLLDKKIKEVESK